MDKCTDQTTYYQRAIASEKFYKKIRGCNILLKWWFHPVVLHEENVVKDSSAGIIFVSNHRSTLDPLVISGVLNKHIHWVALRRFFLAEDSIFNNSKNRFLCWLTAYTFHKLDLIPIERKNDNPNANNVKAIRDMIGYLNIGESIGIFPEGTIKRPGNKDFGNFDESFLKIARSTNSYIQSITILWTEHGRGKKSVALNFGQAFYIGEKSLEAYMKYFCEKQIENMKELRNFMEK